MLVTLFALLALLVSIQYAGQDEQPDGPPASASGAARTFADTVREVAAFSDLLLTDAELEMMLEEVARSRASYAALRTVPLDNSVAPPLYFQPGGHSGLVGERTSLKLALQPPIERPADLGELAFADIPTLAALIRSKRVGCLELCDVFLERLERHDQTLHCLITSTADRARAQALRLDEELAAGNWRGPLHGVPWLAKDLLSVHGTRTTWGAKPFEHQELRGDATVVQRLDAAGAVLLGKVSLGALAWGDVWFGGTTRNPWDPAEGSSGSSAGSTAGTAAGLATFAIGSETLGSIISPCERCGTTGLRPSFGLVPKGGAMNLSWSMDKLGPITRSALDAAIVFDAIRGADQRDPSSVSHPFEIEAIETLEGRRIGVLAGDFDDVPGWTEALSALRELGAELVSIQLPVAQVETMANLLTVEAASVFEDLTRSGRDDELTRQVRQAWPNVFRQAHLVSAVDYLRANRLRTPLIRDVEAAFARFDAVVHPSYANQILQTLNLTGHPTMVVRAGFSAEGKPFSLCFSARLFGESDLLSVAIAWQRATGHHLAHPPAYRK